MVKKRMLVEKKNLLGEGRKAIETTAGEGCPNGKLLLGGELPKEGG